LLATILTKVFNLQDKGVAVVGQLPAGLPVPGLPRLRRVARPHDAIQGHVAGLACMTSTIIRRLG